MGRNSRAGEDIERFGSGTVQDTTQYLQPHQKRGSMIPQPIGNEPQREDFPICRETGLRMPISHRSFCRSNVPQPLQVISKET